MLNSIGRTGGKCDGVACGSCPLHGDNVRCAAFEGEHPEEATAVVRKWAEKHPHKTRKDVLLEKFPNAKIDIDVLRLCAGSLGLVDGWNGVKDCKYDWCEDCWNEEV